MAPITFETPASNSTRTRAQTPWWRRVPGVAFLAVLSAVLVVGLWAASFPGGHLAGVVVFYLGLLVLGAMWILRLVAWATNKERTGTLRWSLVPLLVVSTFAALWADAPLQARFGLSRAAFVDEVADFRAEVAAFEADGGTGGEPQPGTEPRRVGLYDIRRVGRVDWGVHFFEAQGGLLSDYGFAYLPDGPPPDSAQPFGVDSARVYRYDHLRGNWYTFEETFGL